MYLMKQRMTPIDITLRVNIYIYQGLWRELRTESLPVTNLLVHTSDGKDVAVNTSKPRKTTVGSSSKELRTHIAFAAESMDIIVGRTLKVKNGHLERSNRASDVSW
jgi:hypothetical protein